MAKLQMLECISGPLGTYRAGDIWDHPDEADAARIVAAGFAIRVDGLADEPVQPKALENPEAKASSKRSKR